MASPRQIPVPATAAAGGTWEEAVACMAYLIDRHGAALESAAQQAAAVKDRLEAVFPILDPLCRHTCPSCAAPCCAGATVIFDHSDLIFLHLTRQQAPPVQPRPAPGPACAYLTPGGCRLPRLSRPWICTWYVCPAQNRRLSRELRSGLEVKFSEIKALRREMEAAFIRAVARS